ncbi:hypothetical protein Q766_19630 [Flavobacterium subsaxonicum WB 4.1-42 = DSM 21790]|uniref:Uncharacterized protein n=1 Tax=Flavobacterium subsaxonicum WB 4.1-42 = DSM 21790 TaxID=1121898 RepID=A0A0A2MG06_9FLAO|nr:hypothetical protein Q766_19630 [Flavobacterium subsaxonicum WB 4.1-42 = DSM 21790]
MGSSSYITNAAGVVSQHMKYLPFWRKAGRRTLKSIKSPFKFNGKEFDEEPDYCYAADYYERRSNLLDPFIALPKFKIIYNKIEILSKSS